MPGEEKKEPVETTTQAPAQSQEKPGEKKDEKKDTTAGLDLIAKDPKKLRELYKNTPGLFKEVAEEIEAEKKQAKKDELKGQKPQSAAPAAKTAKYGEVEIKLPDDVNEKTVGTYFDHWKEQGWSPEQVQKEVSFMGDLASREKQAQETPEQKRQREDKANTEALKKKWGQDYDKNVEIARRAVLKHGTKDTVARLTNSDPVTVEQFYELGKLDAEDTTPDRGRARSGDEGKKDEEIKDPRSEPVLKKRFPNSPTMKFT